MTLRRAAGVLVVAMSTGRVLMCLRSHFVTEPGVWAVPGGSVDYGETFREAAVREVHEETGYSGSMMVRGPVFVHRDHGLEFQTFLGFVPTQFDAAINWESTSYGWFDIARLPHPLHPGFERMLRVRGRQIAAEISRIRSGR